MSGCAADTEHLVRRGIDSFVAEHGGRLASYGGPLHLEAEPFPPDFGTQLGSSSCRLVAVVVPQGGRFRGYRFQATDREGTGDCRGDQECTIGEARWLFNPLIARSAGATIVYSVFENRSAVKSRTATLTAFFLPPSGWPPD
jgi:hypothetical protein